MAGAPISFSRPSFAQRLAQFEDRIDATNIRPRLMKGQQFNCFEAGSNGEDMDDDVRVYRLCIGPIDDMLWLCDIEGIMAAQIVESAMKAATEAFRERHTPTGASHD